MAGIGKDLTDDSRRFSTSRPVPSSPDGPAAPPPQPGPVPQPPKAAFSGFRLLRCLTSAMNSIFTLVWVLALIIVVMSALLCFCFNF